MARRDQLIIDGEDDRVTVCEIRAPDVDALLDRAVDRVSLAKARLARDVIQARSIGPYSIVTQQPLGGRARIDARSRCPYPR